MAFENIIVTSGDGVGRLTFNRPDKLNAFAGRMRDEIYEGLDELGRDPSVRVIVITGAGRGFCSGADVGYLRELLDRDDSAAFEKLLDAGRHVVTLVRKL